MSDVDVNFHRDTIEATSRLRGILVLARFACALCDRCGGEADPVNICSLPNGKYVQLCDQCVAQIWARCLTPGSG